MSAAVRYAERGSSWWPVLFGPAFAAVGIGIEAATGPVNPVLWVLVGLALAAVTALWVYARRAVCAVTLTAGQLRVGRETLAVRRIAAVDDVAAPAGARVLGGGWAPPGRCGQVPVELRDGSVVLAWARHPERLRDALRPLLGGVPD